MDSDLSTTGLTYLTSSSASFTAATFTGTYTETVYRDSVGNLACPSGGCIDFVLQFNNTSPDSDNYDAIELATLNNFTGYTIDAGVESGSGGVMPVGVKRSTNGRTITYEFGSGVAVGSGSAFLDIQTNALTYTTSTIGFIDGSTATEPGFGPAGAPLTNTGGLTTPEPGTLGMFVMGSAFVVARLQRRRKDNVSEASL
ncbi:MAG: PEP-CTERM sorting domain-containing protein [Acidobacteriota bacterium]|nr:PEP-CTERM sorting domain-containing protein [Acidobacteriota bacterium]